ncbi:hypothetical protein PHET_10918 [Paragonimus heterotremus]|uniref:Uncharacterized protein n=1 Tax=Paragonimus heterotremus TaxID=100268 RepID=A0A8J4WTC9_9TREM|nr:hypothetical protein PHET_10918 [Paragonimus heterotremus]
MEALAEAQRKTSKWASGCFKDASNRKQRLAYSRRLQALIDVEYCVYKELREESLRNQSALIECVRVYMQKLSETTEVSGLEVSRCTVEQQCVPEAETDCSTRSPVESENPTETTVVQPDLCEKEGENSVHFYFQSFQ